MMTVLTVAAWAMCACVVARGLRRNTQPTPPLPQHRPHHLSPLSHTQATAIVRNRARVKMHTGSDRLHFHRWAETLPAWTEFLDD